MDALVKGRCGSILSFYMDTPTSTSTSSASGHMDGVARALMQYNVTHPIYSPPREPNSTDGLTRLIIFNTKRASASDVWTELRAMLGEELIESIKTVRSVHNKHYLPRTDIWVDSTLAQGLIRVIRKMSALRTPSLVNCLKETVGTSYKAKVTSAWRIAIWQPWKDRNVDQPKVMARAPVIGGPTKGPNNHSSEQATSSGDRNGSILTLNVNGFAKKREQVADLFRKEKVIIGALQETLVSAAHYPLRLSGYTSYSTPWKEGFRGNALLVNARYPSYEVPHEASGWILHVKVYSIPGIEGPAHVLAVYLPSGGNHRRERTIVLDLIADTYADILKVQPGAAVFCLGDFNVPMERIDRKMARRSHLVERLKPVGSAVSRFPRVGPPRALDHILASPRAKQMVRKPRVLREYDLSDHRPVMACFRTVDRAESFKPAPKGFRYDRKMIQRNSEKLVNSNRWQIFNDVNLTKENPNLVTSLGIRFDSAMDAATREVGAKVDASEEDRERFPRKLKQLLTRYKAASKRAVEESVRITLGATLSLLGPVRPPPLNELEGRMRVARRRFRKELKTWRRRQQDAVYSQISNDFVAHDIKNVWSRLRAQVTKESRGQRPLQPVRDQNGDLQTNTLGIVEAQAEYYSAMANDVPRPEEATAEHWAKIDLDNEKPELKEINADLRWPEVLTSIRNMRRNTAPGGDETHINVLKVLVLEEGMAMIRMENPLFRRNDAVRVYLEEKKLPSKPLTRMGMALWMVLSTVWELEKLPDHWNEVSIVSLLKKGNPELLTNYRGISLISVSVKVITNVMVERLATAVEKSDLIVPEQSGFRKREEAVSQFLAIQDVVRRRSIMNLPTYCGFIDFKKAYDKVHHEALYRIISSMGIRGKALSLIKTMYADSKMYVRAGGYSSHKFGMKRGLRQGCPLSPLLFILFINRILLDCSAGGVSVPGTGVHGDDPRDALFMTPNEPWVKCAGGLYADDLVGLEETPRRCRRFLRRVDKWGRKWGMELGIEKCGVICCTNDDSEKEKFDRITFNMLTGVIPKVDSYKYLGITVDNTWGDPRDRSLEGAHLQLKHSRYLAEKGAKVLHQFRPLLTDPICPISLKVMVIRNLIMSTMAYGGEWLGGLRTNAIAPQRIVNSAIRWSMGMSASSQVSNWETLSFELGLPTMEAIYTGLRIRLVAKLKRENDFQKTWLRKLFMAQWTKQPGESGVVKKTWTTDHLRVTPAPRDLYVIEGIKDDFTAVYTGGIPKFIKVPIVDPENPDRSLRVNGRTVYERIVDPEWEKLLPADPTVPPEGLDIEEARALCPRKPLGKSILREWAARGALYERQVRSNTYDSVYLTRYYEEFVNLGADGYVLHHDTMIPFYPEHLWDSPFNLHDEARDKFKSLLDSTKLTYSEVSIRLNSRETCLEEMLDRIETSVSGKWYDNLCFGATRGFLRHSISRPDLAEGVRWLMQVRCNAFLSVERRYNALIHTGQEPTFVLGSCPLCGTPVTKTLDWIHLVSDCTHPTCLAARAPIQQVLDDLAFSLNKVENLKAFSEITELSSGTVRGVAAIYFVGGVINRGYDHTYHLGFGQLDFVPLGVETFGYVLAAQFLQEVAPLYALALGLSPYGVPVSKAGDAAEETLLEYE